MIGITDLIAGIFKPAVDLVDELHTSDEEKMVAQAKIQTIQNQALFKLQDYESTVIKAKSDIIIAEAQGKGWLQNSWRPALMALFGIIIANNYILNPWLSALFGIDIILEIPPDMWDLLKLGVGGYIVGRSTEKAIKEFKK